MTCTTQLASRIHVDIATLPQQQMELQRQAQEKHPHHEEQDANVNHLKKQSTITCRQRIAQQVATSTIMRQATWLHNQNLPKTNAINNRATEANANTR